MALRGVTHDPSSSSGGADEAAEETSAETAESPAEQRLRSYIETHNSLRQALETESALQDDEQAARLLLDAGRRALDLMERLQSHDDLWGRLASPSGERLDHDEMEQLRELTDVGLPQLLDALGYSGRPPARELVEELAAGVALAMARDEDPARAARRVALAQHRLAWTTKKLRHVVGTADASLPPSLARDALRVADRELDSTLTATAPVLIEYATEALHPGGGLVVKVGAALCGVVAGRVLSLRPRLDDDALEGGAPSFARIHAYRAAARLVGQAGLVDATAPRDAPARDLAVAQAWVVEEAVRQAMEAEPDDPGRRERLAPLIGQLRAVRMNIITGQPMAALAEAVEAALEPERW